MNELISAYKTLNDREKRKGLTLAVASALLALVWGALSPIVDVFINTQVIDFSTFGSAVSLVTVGKTAFATALSYLGITKYSGEKK